ncbi:glutathione S-transferase family protein [Roseobacter sp. CCS2]|uniref:glutathione S-transferase family protein n=1 Tax=Roseobacter sp. CCS2 TaxID=391593 RepID=UPI0000F3E194|nr:glutathione S-transferase family protein [Roseobacter sp. CCS2]EBA12733.1 glutathione S-transferase-like protein [Roseobacter sp. CCS2]
MTKDLRLYYAPDNASLCVRLALEELGLPYDTTLVDRSVKAQKSDAYLALNPNGLIPVLDTPHGPLFETAAILLWLAETQGRLMPQIGTPARMHAVQWMVWLANTLHPSLQIMFYPAQYADGDPDPTHHMATRRVTAHLDVLSAAQTADWLDSGEPSVHACYLAPMLRWAALYGGGDQWFDLTRWPRLHEFAKRFEARDSACKAASAEGLGETPFSNPSACHPPEGSAL